MNRRVVTTRIERAGSYVAYERTLMIDGLALITEQVGEINGELRTAPLEGKPVNMKSPRDFTMEERDAAARDITRKLTFIYGKPTS